MFFNEPEVNRLGLYQQVLVTLAVTELNSNYCAGQQSESSCKGRGQSKCDGTRAETRFRLSAKRKSPFKSAGTSVQSTTGSRGVRISVSNAGYTMFRGSVRSTGYPLHSPMPPSTSLPCVTVCHHISTGVYVSLFQRFKTKKPISAFILTSGTGMEYN